MSNLEQSSDFLNPTRALLSIKPYHAEKIFVGKKKYEFRRTMFSRKVDIIMLYVTSPVQRVVGEFDVLGVISSPIDTLWKKTNKHAGIDKRHFYNYFTGLDKGHAIEIGEIRLYKHPFCPQEWLGLKPPQSFAYIDSTCLFTRVSKYICPLITQDSR